MRAKLTRQLLRTLQPAARPYDCRDTELTGFLLRVQPSGRRAWFYQYRTASGRQTRLKLGHEPGLSPDGARTLALARAAEVARGEDPIARKRAARAQAARARISTLRAFIDERYRPWAVAHLRSGPFQIARLRSDFEDWLDRPMAELDLAAVESRRREWMRAGLRPRSVNRDIQRLRSVLSRAVEWGVLDSHPLAGLKPLKYDRTGRVRYLTPAEEAALRTALEQREAKLVEARQRFNEWRIARGRKPLPPRSGAFIDHLRPMALVALNTGLRRGELLDLRWSNVDLDEKWLTVVAASAKSGQTRRVPLNEEAAAVLSAWRALSPNMSDDGFVFHGPNGQRMSRIDTSWRGVVAAAGLSNFHFHDLRHSFASKLVQARVDLNTVRELLGHSDITMTLKYSHLSPDGLAKAVALI